jgi:hypothetical protein
LWTNENPFLALLILGNFCLEKAKALLYLSIAFTDIFIKPSFMCNGGKQIFAFSSKAGCATFF